MVSSQVMEPGVEPATLGGDQLVNFSAGERTCIKCGGSQAFSEFGANETHPTGIFKTCRSCRNAKRFATVAERDGRSEGEVLAAQAAQAAPGAPTSLPPVEVSEEDRAPGRPALRVLKRDEVPGGRASSARRLDALDATRVPPMSRSLRNLLVMRAIEALERGSAGSLVYPMTSYHAHFSLIGDGALEVDLPEFLAERGAAPSGYDWKVCLLCGHVSLVFVNKVVGQELSEDQLPDRSPFTLPDRLVKEAAAIFAGYASGNRDARQVFQREQSVSFGAPTDAPPETGPEPPGDSVVETAAQDAEPPQEAELAPTVIAWIDEAGAESVADSVAGEVAEGVAKEATEGEQPQETTLPPAQDWQQEVSRLRMELNDAWCSTVILQGSIECQRDMIAGMSEQNARLQAEVTRLRDELAQADLKHRSTEISLRIAEREREIVELRFEQWKVECRLDDMKTPPVLPRAGATERLPGLPGVPLPPTGADAYSEGPRPRIAGW